MKITPLWLAVVFFVCVVAPGVATQVAGKSEDPGSVVKMKWLLRQQPCRLVQMAVQRVAWAC